jgi:hypothetical protein
MYGGGDDLKNFKVGRRKLDTLASKIHNSALTRIAKCDTLWLRLHWPGRRLLMEYKGVTNDRKDASLPRPDGSKRTRSGAGLG